MEPAQKPGATSDTAKLLRRLLLLPIILVLLFEEWGWEPLARGFKSLAKLPLWGAVERHIQGLPPTGALLVFAIPVLGLLPVKALALYLLGSGHVFMGAALVIGAKIVGTAVAARLFQLTEPALMKLRWFARLYTPWKAWKDRMLAQVRRSALWQHAGQLAALSRAAARQGWTDLKARFSRRAD